MTLSATTSPLLTLYAPRILEKLLFPDFRLFNTVSSNPETLFLCSNSNLIISKSQPYTAVLDNENLPLAFRLSKKSCHEPAAELNVPSAFSQPLSMA